MQNLVNEFLKGTSLEEKAKSVTNRSSGGLSSGLLGGAAAGGIAALVLGKKPNRKLATKIVKYGGSAVLGGLAFKAYSSWKNQPQNNAESADTMSLNTPPRSLELHPDENIDFVCIQAMIAAAKSDGKIDSKENRKLHEAIMKAKLGAAETDLVFDLLESHIDLDQLAEAIVHEDHKAQVYLAAFLAIEVDQDAEREFLDSLAAKLGLNPAFARFLEHEALTAEA